MTNIEEDFKEYSEELEQVSLTQEVADIHKTKKHLVIKYVEVKKMIGNLENDLNNNVSGYDVDNMLKCIDALNIIKDECVEEYKEL